MNRNTGDIPENPLNLDPAEFEPVNWDDIGNETFKTKPIAFFKDAMLRLARNKVAVASCLIIASLIVLCVVGPFFTGYNYVEQNLKFLNMPPRIPLLEDIGVADGTRLLKNRKKSNLAAFPEGSIIEIKKEYVVSNVEVVDVLVDYYKYVGAEDAYFWFGSDYLGRDLLTRLLYGGRISLLIAFFSVLTNLVIGVIYGAIAGYYGGRVDMLMMRFAEILSGIPHLVMTMMFILLFGTGLFAIILALTVTGWIGTARLVRAQFYRFKGREFVLAARTLGVPDRKLIFRHILPNSVGPLITRSMVAIPGAIFSESFLAYIGLGIQAPNPSIGVMLSDGQKVLLQYPCQTLFPALLISVLMIAFNLFSNGLRDALDPTKRGEE